MSNRLMDEPFGNVESAPDVEQRMHKLLPLRKSKSEDVQSVLNSMGIECSSLIEHDERFDYSIAHLVTQPYDQFVQCLTPAPSSSWLILDNEQIYMAHTIPFSPGPSGGNYCNP